MQTGSDLGYGATTEERNEPVTIALLSYTASGDTTGHLHSFIGATRPKPSSNHNLKSTPQVLTGDSMFNIMERNLFRRDSVGVKLSSEVVPQTLILA